MAPNRFSSRNGLKHLRFGRNLVQNDRPGEPDKLNMPRTSENINIDCFLLIFVSKFGSKFYGPVRALFL